VLATFVIFTIGFAVGKEVGARRTLASLPPQDTPTNAGEAAQPNQVAAWYFHSTKRCKKCNTIEAFAKEALETHFAEQMADGTVTWQTANMDDVWNADAVRRYGLIRSSVVLVDMRDGVEQDHAVLSQTWELLDNKENFLAYVESEVEMIIDAWSEDDENEE
jgi:hypothetical protein